MGQTNDRARAARSARGVSQVALAVAAGLSRQSMSAIEAGRELRMQRPCDALASASLRRELDALGYDVRSSRERAPEVRPA